MQEFEEKVIIESTGDLLSHSDIYSSLPVESSSSSGSSLQLSTGRGPFTVETVHGAVFPETIQLESTVQIKFVIRGKVYTGNELEFSSRDGSVSFTAASPLRLLPKIILRDTSSIVNDFQGITVQEIIDFLAETGNALTFERNPLMQEACKLSIPFNGLTPSIIEASYRQVPMFFSPPILKQMVENEIGSRFLDGWVEVPVLAGRAKVRAYGAKALHIIAGNVPLVAALSVIRGALTKSDNIIKLPSNDPLTATAILETMRDIDKTHPVVKHFSAVYWKGGDQEFERRLVTPFNLEKIIAWGGHNSIKNIKSLVGPGIDLITLDPKFSISIIGEEAFESDASMIIAAFRAANDSAAYNQEACVTSRTHFVKTTPEKAAMYSRYLYMYMQEQDPSLSTRPKSFPASLKENIDSLRFMEGFYEVIGGEHGEGAVITSLAGEPVEFFPSCKTVNVIPIDDYQEALEMVTVATQTVGIYPESLKDKLMDELVARGVQRFVSLGQAAGGMVGVPHDAMEPMRRACKWIVNEISVP
ncbi:MAG: acyl-CoA reductase [Candidatus Odinarchaeota archaeon]